MKVAAAAALFLAAAALAAAGAAAWLGSRDPLASLPREGAEAPRAVEELVERREGRLLTSVTLETSGVGTVRFFVSRPEPSPGRVPVMGVAAGQRTGVEALSLFGDPGPNAVVWYRWPFPPELRCGWSMIRRGRALRRAAISVPGQLDAALRWASRQPWADPGRVSLHGYSLGSLVVPAAQRLVQARGGAVGWTVLAYGGAPLREVIEANRSVRRSWGRPLVGAAAALLLRPVEPSAHLPELRGTFLVLGGKDDPVVPPAAAERMRRLAPEPCTAILFEGAHVGVGEDRRKLLERVVAASRSWLVAEGAIDPPAGAGSPPWHDPGARIAPCSASG